MQKAFSSGLENLDFFLKNEDQKIKCIEVNMT